jgi:hypothetical protein
MHLLAATLIACGGAEHSDVAAINGIADRQGVIDLTIGGVDAPDAKVFGRISGLALGPSGRIFVADHQANEIRVFSSHGTHLFTFGRRGAGPGETDGPCCLAFGPDGQLWLRDSGNARYASFEILFRFRARR